MDRSGQPGHRGAAPALRLPPHPDPGRPRPLPAHHAAGVVHRPVDQAPARPGRRRDARRRARSSCIPPFRWQRQYARDFVDGIWRMANETDVRFAVENMYPWRYRDREMLAYAPDWDVTKDDYRHFTDRPLAHRDRPHRRPGDGRPHGRPPRPRPPRRRQGLRPRTSTWCPGRGTQPCAELLERLAPQRLRRPCRHRGQHPPRHVRRRTRGRPRRGAGLHPAAPRLVPAR